MENQFHWFEDGSPIPEANENTLVLDAELIGRRIYFEATFMDLRGTEEIARSTETTTVQVAIYDLEETIGADTLTGGQSDDTTRTSRL